MRRGLSMLLTGVLVVALTGPAHAQGRLDGNYYGSVREWSRRLVNDLEYLQQDISYEVKGPGGRQLADLANATYQSAVHFNRGLRNDVAREHLYRDFQQLDAHLHKLLRAVRDVGPAGSSLQRAAQRVHYSDQQLHYALSAGDDTPDRGRDVLGRQTDVLVHQAAEYIRVMDWATMGSGAGARLRDAARAFSDAARRLERAEDRSVDPNRLRQDFVRVADAWREVVNALNAPEASPGQYLRTKTMEVHETVEHIRQRLNMRDPYVRLRD